MEATVKRLGLTLQSLYFSSFSSLGSSGVWAMHSLICLHVPLSLWTKWNKKNYFTEKLGELNTKGSSTIPGTN